MYEVSFYMIGDETPIACRLEESDYESVKDFIYGEDSDEKLLTLTYDEREIIINVSQIKYIFVDKPHQS